MSEESEDDSSKTEEPSQRKLDEARKKGQMVSSREINHFFLMAALLVFVMLLAPAMGRQAIDLLAPLITKADSYAFDEASLKQLFSDLARGGALLMLLPTLVTVLAAIAPAVVQGKWAISTESIAPKWKKISPLANFAKTFGLKGMVESLKNLLKISIVAVVGVMAVLPYRDTVLGSIRLNVTEVLGLAGYIAGRILIAVCIMLFLLSIGDYLYQRFIFMKSMRMSKQEVKDEYKQQEGDPHVKGRFKQIRREKARKRMMANVPNANVIITNPTHFAVALQYDAATMQAPKLLAKGVDEVAAKIREIAEKNKIPIVRNPPLARALYDTAEIDETIPVQHYQAVAKIISYVYKIKGKALPAPRKKPPSSLGNKKK